MLVRNFLLPDLEFADFDEILAGSSSALKKIATRPLRYLATGETSKIGTTYQTLRLLELLLGQVEYSSLTTSMTCTQNKFIQFLIYTLKLH